LIGCEALSGTGNRLDPGTDLLFSNITHSQSAPACEHANMTHSCPRFICSVLAAQAHGKESASKFSNDTESLRGFWCDVFVFIGSMLWGDLNPKWLAVGDRKVVASMLIIMMGNPTQNNFIQPKASSRVSIWG
jgi:hypothetical protein